MKLLRTVVCVAAFFWGVLITAPFVMFTPSSSKAQQAPSNVAITLNGQTFVGATGFVTNPATEILYIDLATFDKIPVSGVFFAELAGLTFAGSGVFVAGDIDDIVLPGPSLLRTNTRGVLGLITGTDRLPKGLAFVSPVPDHQKCYKVEGSVKPDFEPVDLAD